MASLTDKITDIRNAARPNSARVSSGRGSGGTTLACDNLTGWPVTSKVHFVTYKIDSNSNPVAGSQLDCEGIVSSNNISQFTVIDGVDNGNIVGDVVEMLPTAAWGQDLADALTTEHGRTGLHDSTKVAMLAGTQTFTGPKTFTTMPVAPNPYKFRAHPAVTQTGVNEIMTTVTLGTEDYDPNNNFAANTYTVPVTGTYQLNALVAFSNTPGLYTGCDIQLLKNGTTPLLGSTMFDNNVSYDFISATYNDCVQLNANDTIVLQGQPLLVSGTGGFSTRSFFSGFLINQT